MLAQLEGFCSACFVSNPIFLCFELSVRPSLASKVNPAVVQAQSVAKEFLLAPGPSSNEDVSVCLSPTTCDFLLLIVTHMLC